MASQQIDRIRSIGWQCWKDNRYLIQSVCTTERATVPIQAGCGPYSSAPFSVFPDLRGLAWVTNHPTDRFQRSPRPMKLYAASVIRMSFTSSRTAPRRWALGLAIFTFKRTSALVLFLDIRRSSSGSHTSPPRPAANSGYSHPTPSPSRSRWAPYPGCPLRTGAAPAARASAQLRKARPPVRTAPRKFRVSDDRADELPPPRWQW